MSFSATYWTTNWADVRVQHDFTGASFVSTRLGPVGTTTYWLEFFYDAHNIRQLDASGDSSLNNKNCGRFYVANAAKTDIRDINYVYVTGHLPSNPSFSGGVGSPPSGSGYLYPNPPSAVDEGYPSCSGRLYYIRPASGGSWYDLWHFQPHTYYGNPAEVISAILMHIGGDDDYIDKTNFSNSDDGLKAMTTEPMVLVTREVGETIGDTIKRVARHCNDILCVNMAGDISLVSRSLPPSGPTSLTVADTVGQTSWRYAREYVVNRAVTSFGEWTVNWGSRNGYPGQSGWTYSTRFDRNAEFDTARDLEGVFEDTASEAKFGSRVYSNVKQEVQAFGDDGEVVDGEYVKRPAMHFRHFYDEDCRDAVMARLTAKESTLRREVEVVQDLRGLDYDIGYEVSDVQVTGDGETIAAMTCVEKEIDFGNLTVRSVLLEEPS